MSEAVQTFTSRPVFSLRNLLNYCLEDTSQAARILGCSEVLTIQYTNFHLIYAPSHPLMSSPIHPSPFKCSVPLVQTPRRVSVFILCLNREGAVARLLESSQRPEI